MILALQNRILEMTARGASLATTLDCLCQEVEGAATDVVCSVLSVDPSGALHPLSGPSLPDSYSAALDGLQMGPLSGSCGTAAYLGEPVIVIDIENDPRWASFKQLALPLGFKACWSTPIESAGRVCGTFAFYFKTCRGPSSFEISLLEACVHLCAIAIERNDRVLERQRLTYTDTLTGLPNRTRFQEYLAERSQSIGAAWGILIIDIDNLKPVNDTFGHGAGDDLIKIVASRISLVSGHGSTFRVGGDEFAAIVDGEDNDLRETAEKILASLKPTCVCETHVVFPAATIGGAIWKNHANPELVRRDADLALYHAKETKRGRYVEYYGGLGSTISRRFRAIRNVGLALRENRIDAYYQPIIRLDTREIVGVEALCRMTAETGAIIAASHFHEATKDAHVASELTQRMLGLVASDVRRWLDLGIPFQHVGD
jgi:diguanylate cyclase (GGDEF)-like protein